MLNLFRREYNHIISLQTVLVVSTLFYISTSSLDVFRNLIEEIILIKLKHFYDENSEKGECDKLFYCSK